jgi:hypothetical protein
MPLTMRPSGLASTGYYKDHADYLIFCGGWNIGRIYEIRSGPEDLRWFWALHFPSRPENLRTDNRAGSLEGGEGGIRGVLAQVEGVGQAGRGGLTDGCASISGGPDPSQSPPKLIAYQC